MPQSTKLRDNKASMKISLKQTNSFDKGDFKGNIYVAKKGGKKFSALLVECITRHYKTRIKGVSRMYLVIEGTGTFTINEQKSTVGPNDFLIVSDGDTYEYEGKMKLFEFNIPAADETNQENLEI